MHKRLILLSLLVLMATFITARPVDRHLAEQKAMKFLSNKGKKMASPLTLCFQGRQQKVGQGTPDRDAYYYVFNKGSQDGFVVMSGDDVAADVLGYADKGSFHIDQISPEMKEWLDGYARQIAWARKQGVTKVKTSSSQKDEVAARQAIAPLTQTRWTQRGPFNLLCQTSDGQTAVAGCVANALAQVMFYHQWPLTETTEIPAYEADYGINSGSVAYDALEPIVFDWGNMQLSYNGTEELDSPSALAAAQLVSYCGHAVKMEYGVNSSGAPSTLCCPALVDYFHYAEGCREIFRDNYDWQQWDSIIYDELLNGRPLIYVGYTHKGSGHAFVCDGFDGHGFYHINWGWGGLSNGYFRLQALNPLAQSTGGSTGGYSLEQSAIVGISPTPVELHPLVVDAEKQKFLKVYDLSVSENTNGTVDGQDNDFSRAKVHIRLLSLVNAKLDVALGLFQGDELLKVSPFVTDMVFNQSSYLDKNFVDLAGLQAELEDGTYQIKALGKYSETDDWKPCIWGDDYYVEVVVNQGQVSFANVTGNCSELELVGVEQRFDNSAKRQIRVTMFNPTEREYNAPLYLYIDNTCYSGENLVIPPHQTGYADLFFTYKADKAPNLRIEDNWNYVVYQTNSFSFEESSGSTLPMVLDKGMTSIDETNHILYGSVAEAWVVLRNDTPKDYEGCFNFQVKIMTSMTSSSVKSRTYTTTEKVVLKPGETRRYFLEYPCWSYGDELWFNVFLEGTNLLSVGSAANRFVVTPGYIEWDEKGMRRGKPVTAEAVVAEDALAVSFDGLDLSAMSILPNSNPNTIYYLPFDTPIPESLKDKNVVVGHRAVGDVRLKEGQGYHVPYHFYVDGKVSYQRTPTVACDGCQGWQTLVLPFAVSTVCSGEDVVEWTKKGDREERDFWVKELDSMEGDVANFSDIKEWLPNHPYLLGTQNSFKNKPMTLSATNTMVMCSYDSKALADGYEFCGTGSDASLSQAYVMNALGNAFERTDQATVKAGEAYFIATQSEAAQVKKIRIGGLLGDADGDGIVNVVDAMLIVNYIIEGGKASLIRRNADIDYSGVIDVTDVMAVVRIILDN